MLLYVIFKIEIMLVQGVQRRSISSFKKGSVMKGKQTAWQTHVCPFRTGHISPASRDLPHPEERAPFLSTVPELPGTAARRPMEV